MWRVCGFPSLFRGPPVACRALSRLLVAAVCRVWWFVVSSSLPSLASLSPLGSVSWGSAVLVARLGWCSSSRSVLVWVSSRSAPLSCRVGSAPPAVVSALVASLRAARSSGLPVCLGVRSGWSGSRWFCAVAPASASACAAADVALDPFVPAGEPGRLLSRLRVGVRELAAMRAAS